MISKQTRLIVFDWDGTLMDSTGRIVSAMQTTATNLKLPVPSVDDVRGIIGLNLTECYKRLFPEVDDHDWITKEYRYQYVEGDPTPSPLFEGTAETLEHLKNNGHLIAVATGKAREGLDRVLNDSGLKSLFDLTIASDEAQGKPHPEMLNKLMSHTKTSPEQSIMVGDTTFDLQMAKKAGMPSIGVTFGAHTIEMLRSCQPQAIIDDIRQLKGRLS